MIDFLVLFPELLPSAAELDGAIRLYGPPASLEIERRGLPPAEQFAAVLEIENRAPPRDVRGAAYRVRDRILKVSADPEALFLISPVHRAPDMSVEAFDAHWRIHHAPLALAHHAGMSSYRQLVVTECLSPNAPAYDGIGILGFPSIGAFERDLYDTPEGRRAIAADTARFVDVGRLEVALLELKWNAIESQ